MQQSKKISWVKEIHNHHSTKSSNTNNYIITKTTPKYPVVQHCCVTTSLFLLVCLETAIGNRQGHFMDELLMGEKASHKKIGNEHKCAHLYLLVRKKSPSPAINSIKNINTKNDLKNFLHEQNTLPNAPLKMTIRATEVEVVGATFPLHSLTNNITGWTIERSGENSILLQKLHLIFWTPQLVCQWYGIFAEIHDRANS